MKKGHNLTNLNLEDIDNNELVLIIVSSDMAQVTNLKILKYLINTKKSVFVYTTFTKPFHAINKVLEKNNIRTDEVFFIDCVTPVAGYSEMLGTDKGLFCQPQSLTNISIAIKTALENVPKGRPKVLVLDNLSTLMLYNNPEYVIRFIHSLSAKVRMWTVKSLFFSLDEDTDKRIVSQLSQFCDVCLRVNKGL
jgi:hypothetical protein